MRHSSLPSGNGFSEIPPDRHGCCKPCCGYILEEIHDCHRERCCFDGVVSICGLSACLAPPLTLCSTDVVCIAPACTQDRRTFRLTLRCEVIDSRGCRASGEACICVTIRQLPTCGCANLRLGACIDVQRAEYCSASAFRLCADVRLMMVASGPGRLIRQQMCAKHCLFPPLYPAPLIDDREKH